MKRDAPFSVRLKDATTPLEAGSLIAGESRGQFIREAVKERADRFLREARKRQEGGDALAVGGKKGERA